MDNKLPGNKILSVYCELGFNAKVIVATIVLIKIIA